MTTLLLVAAIAAGMMLILAGFAHLAHPRRLGDIIVRQRLLPATVATPAAALFAAVEVSVGVWLFAALVTGSSAPLVLTAAMYAAFTIHIARLLRLPDAAPCGCTSGTRPANVWALGRAAALSIALTLLSVSPPTTMPPGAPRVLLLLCAATLTLLAWVLPDALHIPGRTREDKYALVR